MNKILAILGGAGIGAALMYLFDPQEGNRRRTMIRDKAVGLSNNAQKALHRTSEDLGNRARGLLNETKALFTHKGQLTAENPDT